MSFYSYPLVYSTLVNPESALVEAVQAWALLHLGRAPQAVLDPACGPGKWLLPFAEAGARVAGVDLEPAMVDEAYKLLWRHGPELVHGDMRELPLLTGPFDLALNLYSSVAHLENFAEVAKHLRRMQEVMAPGGLYFLGLTIHERGDPIEVGEALFQAPATPIPGGGMAAVHYESGGIDAQSGREIIRILLLTKGVAGVPEQLADDYSLMLFPAHEIEALVAAAGFTIVEVRAMRAVGWPAVPLAPGCGDVTLILRRI